MSNEDQVTVADLAEAMRLVEYDMLHRAGQGKDGFIAERGEVAKIITALRHRLAQPASDREAVFNSGYKAAAEYARLDGWECPDALELCVLSGNAFLAWSKLSRLDDTLCNRSDTAIDSWTGEPQRVSSELRRVANVFEPGFRIVQLLRDAADEIDTLYEIAALTPSNRSDAVDVQAGMKPWHGGDDAPADWDGGRVQFRHGGCSIRHPGEGMDWRHFSNEVSDGRTDIIAYTPKPVRSDAVDGETALRELAEQNADMPSAFSSPGDQAAAIELAVTVAIAALSNTGTTNGGGK